MYLYNWLWTILLLVPNDDVCGEDGDDKDVVEEDEQGSEETQTVDRGDRRPWVGYIRSLTVLEALLCLWLFWDEKKIWVKILNQNNQLCWIQYLRNTRFKPTNQIRRAEDIKYKG